MSVFERTRDSFNVSDDPARLDLAAVHAYLARSYADGFVVFEDSQARSDERASAASYIPTERVRLLTEGRLVEVDGHLVFGTDTEFSSPSAAASVVCGGNMNGLTAWRDEHGRTLKDIETQ